MKLTIFPKAKALPKSKEEKTQEAKFVSFPHKPVTVEVKSEDDLIAMITQHAWSPSIFEDYRRNSDFISTDFMVLDIDNGMTIPQAEKRCDELGYCYLILPTTSHKETDHRFRIIFPLVRTVYSRDEFDATWNYLQEQFPELDKQCSDYARFYFGSTTIDGCFSDGDMLEPTEVIPHRHETMREWKMISTEDFDDKELLEVLYEKVPENLPERVDFFLKNAHTGLPDGWTVPLNACVFTLALQGVPYEKVYFAIDKVAPDVLDSRDEATIDRAWSEGNLAREESQEEEWQTILKDMAEEKQSQKKKHLI